MANLRVNLDKAVFDALNVSAVLAVAPGGVYNSVAPPSTQPPWVVFQAFSKIDDYWAFTQRGGSALYQVKAVSLSRWPKEAGDIDTQIDTALQDATLTITGFSQFFVRRESDFYLQEPRGSEIFFQIGGLYRIIADET